MGAGGGVRIITLVTFDFHSDEPTMNLKSYLYTNHTNNRPSFWVKLTSSLINLYNHPNQMCSSTAVYTGEDLTDCV